MKKLIKIFCLIFCFSLVIGCNKSNINNKIIECLSNDDDITTKLVASVDADKVTKIKQEIVMSYDETISNEQFNMIKTIYESMYSETVGITFDINRNGEKIIIIANFDLLKMSTDDIEAYFEKSSLSSKSFKKIIQSAGGSCK